MSWGDWISFRDLFPKSFLPDDGALPFVGLFGAGLEGLRAKIIKEKLGFKDSIRSLNNKARKERIKERLNY